MNGKDNFPGKLSFFGRLADEITREVIPSKSFTVSIQNSQTTPQYKEAGFFAFSNIEHSPTEYQFHLTAWPYQSRIVGKKILSGLPVELSFEGEDELYVLIQQVQNETNKKVIFANLPFLKTISKGALVYGESGFSTTLSSTLEGEDIRSAVLDDISGLSTGKMLRFVRSKNILMKPGPYYSFAPDSTILSLKFVDNSTTDKPPLSNVKCKIIEINGVEPNQPTYVGNVAVYTITLPDPVGKIIIGTENNITTYSNERGDAVFYYPANTVINRLKLEITAEGYILPAQPEIDLVSKQRTFKLFELTKI